MVMLSRKAMMGATGGTPFSPRDINGLRVWLDASDSTTLYQDDEGTTPATANNAPVGRWEDKSGQNNHATQPNDALRPALIESVQLGKTVVRQVGSAYLNLSPSLARDIPSATIIAVSRVPDAV